jgi:hypothetical protein
MNTACGVALMLSLAAAPPPLMDKRGDVEARASLDAAEIRLSGEVRLTITVEAPGQLTVTPPKPLLTKGNLWRVREDGLPTREVGGKREKWTQVYRLSPLVPGKPEIALGAFSVRDGTGRDTVIDWNHQALTAEVKTTIESPSVESLRPATDVEQLPPPPAIERGRSSWLFAVVPALLIVAAIFVYFGRRKRGLVTPRDAAWALSELVDPKLTVDHCALVLRQYLAYRFGVPAEMRTTPELANTLRADDRLPAEVAAEWESVLAECDAARFSGTAAAVGGLADRARELVAISEPQAIAVQNQPAAQTRAGA